MLFLSILLLLSVAYSRIIRLEDVYVYTTDLGDFFFHNNHIVYQVADENGFKIEIGRASIVFEIDETKYKPKAKILDFKKLIEKKIIGKERLGYKIPKMFDRKLNLSFFRHDWKEICLSIGMAKSHLHLMNLQLKLMSGYRTEYDEVNSYISSDCIECEKRCYDSPDTVASCGWNSAARIDRDLKGRTFSSNVHFIGWTFSGSGMGSILSEDEWLEGNDFWVIVQILKNGDPMSSFEATLHNIGHNMGYNHANHAPKGTGFVKKYQMLDGTTDSSTYMGWGSEWYQIPGAGHWIKVNNQGSVFPPWVRQCESGVHKYRLLAWDYAYTRVFLGDEKRIPFKENDTIDGIPFRYNTAGIIIEYGNSTFNTALSPLIHGSIAMEYRWFSKGLKSYQNRGIKFTISDFDNGTKKQRSYSMALDAEVDGNSDELSSEIPLKYMKVPEIDIGTMKFKITKFHTIKDINPNPNLLETFPTKTITLEDIPYLEIEITHSPNVALKKPTKVSPLPEIIFSPTLNCTLVNEMYKCDFFNEVNYWSYIKAGPSRDNTLPRFYTLANTGSASAILTGRLGVVSFPGNDYGYHQVITGSMDTEIVRKTNVTITRLLPYTEIYQYSYEQCAVKKLNTNTGQFEPFVFPGYESDLYDVTIVNNYNESLFNKMTLKDLYLNVFEIRKISNDKSKTHIILLKPLPLHSFSKLLLSYVNKNDHIIEQNIITRLNTKPSKRIAISDYDSQAKSYTITTASLEFRTANAFIGPIKTIKGLWYYYPFVNADLRDYLFIDFEGSVPSDLSISIETENGVFQKELGYLTKFKDPTVRIQVVEISQATGGWGEIYKFQFNSEVMLLSIRLSLSKHTAVQPGESPVANFTETIGSEKYRIECSLMLEKYQFNPFTVEVLGNQLTFNKSSDAFIIKEKAVGRLKSKLM